MQKILLLTPKGIEVKEVEEVSLEIMQACVDGYIERVYVESLDKKHIDVFCNDCGKLENMPPALYLLAEGKVYDVVAGNILFCKYDNDGNSLGLEDSDIDYLKEKLNVAVFAEYGILPYLTQEGE